MAKKPEPPPLSHRRLTYRGIQIRAVHEGVANTVLVGLRRLVGQLCREDGAAMRVLIGALFAVVILAIKTGEQQTAKPVYFDIQ